MTQRFLISLLLSFASQFLFSQQTHNTVAPEYESPGEVFTGQVCPDPPPPGGLSCNNSCGYCNIDGLEGNNSVPVTGGESGCPSIAVHNDVWYGFVAGTYGIEFEVVPSNCVNGDGLQVSILDECDDNFALACNPGCGGCGDISLNLGYSGFEPGKTYWLMIDGWVSDVCDFQINVISGSATPPLPQQPEQPSGPTTVCAGATAVYSVPTTFGAGTYHWSAPPGSSINGGGNNLFVPAPEGTTVTITFGNNGGNVCLQCQNDCNPASNFSCLSVELQPIIENYLPPLTVCDDELPYTWPGDSQYVLENPGVYDLISGVYQAQIGCDSVVHQIVTVYPPVFTFLGPVYICEGECFEVGGIEFCTEGNQAATLSTSYGCDSTVYFNLVVLKPVADIQGPPGLFCHDDFIVLNSAASSGQKEWTDTTGQVLGNADTLLVTSPGTYVLTTTVDDGGLICMKSDTLMVVQDTAHILVSIEGETEGCSFDPLLLFSSYDDVNATYEWTGPSGIVSTLPNAPVSELGQYFLAVSTIDGCTGFDSVMVEQIGGTPDIMLTPDTLTCVDSIGQLICSTTSQIAEFSWTGPNGFMSNEQNPVVTDTGMYMLTIITEGLCTNTDSTFLYLNRQSPSAFIQFDTIYCFNPIMLNCETNASDPIFHWSGPNGFESDESNPEVTLGGTFFVTVTDASTGCTSSHINSIININYGYIIYDLTVTQPSSGLNNGSIVIIFIATGGNDVTYTWYSNGNQIGDTQDIYNLGPGVYTLVVSDEFGCSTEYVYTLVGSSGTDDIANVNKWQVMPNPSTGIFVLSNLYGQEKVLGLRVFDINGRQLLNQEISDGSKQQNIDLSDQAAGVYYLEIKYSEGSEWLKLVVQQ